MGHLFLLLFVSQTKIFLFGPICIYFQDPRAIQVSNIGTLYDEGNPFASCGVSGVVGRGNLSFKHPR